jgi:hypothetical protein
MVYNEVGVGAKLDFDVGPSGGSSVRGPGREDPHQRKRKNYF